ncbi:MAG: thioredoxin family protein, partial [Anaerolineales bacterium]|nr:thioredoxin family protein [Anaerolineales bacterium]
TIMEAFMLKIKILGPGCANCSKVEQITRKAVAEMGFQAEFSKVTDYGEIMTYPIISTPGLVINGDVVCSGRVPTQTEITTWLVNAQG